MFGPHLVLEGYNCKKKDILSDENKINQFLESIPPILDMHIIMAPKSHKFQGANSEECGVSSVLIIAESHISIHTWPEKACFSLDIFSCKPFDEGNAIKFILDTFEPEKSELLIFDRGREFPRSLGRASEIIKAERSTIEARI